MIQIEKQKIGYGAPCYVVAEIGLNHNGDVALAKRMIEVAADCGANAVKFQKRTVSRLAIASVLDSVDQRFPEFGKTYRQVREHIEFGEKEFKELICYSRQKKLAFLCTAFDEEAVDFLEALNVTAYKVASHSLTNLPLLEKIAQLKKPMILSTGMCTFQEIDEAVKLIQACSAALVLLHCVSSYPQAPHESNLRLIHVLRERYDLPIGYSGHEIGYLPTLAAVAMGACVVERHITLDTKMVGFDHKLSLDPENLKSMIRDIRIIESTFGSATKTVTPREQVTRDKYHVSMVSALDIPKGAVLDESMVTYKNPGTGIPPRERKKVLGKRTLQDISKDQLITQESVE